MHRSARCSPGLTGRPSGHPKGVAFWLPLNFNVRPFMRSALASERFGRIARGAIQARQGRPRLPVLRRSAHRRLCAIEVAPRVQATSSRVAAGAPPPGGAGRACAAASPLSVALLSPGSRVRLPSARLRVAGNASWCGAAGRCGEQNTRSVVGRACAQVVPLFAKPNPSIERTAKRLRLLPAAHVER